MESLLNEVEEFIEGTDYDETVSPYSILEGFENQREEKIDREKLGSVIDKIREVIRPDDYIELSDSLEDLDSGVQSPQ